MKTSFKQMNPGGPIMHCVVLYHDLQMGTVLQLVAVSVGVYVRSSLLYIWHTAAITFLPPLAVLTVTNYSSR